MPDLGCGALWSCVLLDTDCPLWLSCLNWFTLLNSLGSVRKSWWCWCLMLVDSPSPDSSWWAIDMAADPGEVEGTTVVEGRCGGNVCRIIAWVWPLVLKFLIIWTQNWTKPKPYYMLWVTVWLKPDVLWEELMVPERGAMFYFSSILAGSHGTQKQMPF